MGVYINILLPNNADMQSGGAAIASRKVGKLLKIPSQLAYFTIILQEDNFWGRFTGGEK